MSYNVVMNTMTINIKCIDLGSSSGRSSILEKGRGGRGAVRGPVGRFTDNSSTEMENG
jgi:hypothetical protein